MQHRPHQADRLIPNMARANHTSRRSFPTLLIALAAIFSVSSQATAQQSSLTPVEQAVADISPLSISLRQLEPDFGAPQQFDRVYTSPDFPGMYLRVNGALTAVFPQSEYVITNDGISPILPRNTEFFIGLPPRLTPTAPGVSSKTPSSQLPSALDSRQDHRAPTRRLSSASAPKPPSKNVSFTPGDFTPTLWSSEQQRRLRVAYWLSLAADANPG
jgi:hypothetical protein